MSGADDPVAHAAKFLAIFAFLPLIFVGVALALPDMGGAKAAIGPGVFGAVTLGIAFGVYRRSKIACTIGMVVFALAMAAIVGVGVFGTDRRYAIVFWAAILAWPILKLRAAHAALA